MIHTKYTKITKSTRNII